MRGSVDSFVKRPVILGRLIGVMTAERTKNRPLASGRLSVFAATVFLFIQYFIGIVFFYFTLETCDLAYVPTVAAVLAALT